MRSSLRKPPAVEVFFLSCRRKSLAPCLFEKEKRKREKVSRRRKGKLPFLSLTLGVTLSSVHEHFLLFGAFTCLQLESLILRHPEMLDVSGNFGFK